MRSTFRVNYYVNGATKTAYVVAESGQEASDFLGVRDGSVSVEPVAYPVQVVGLDTAHQPIAPPPVFTAPPEPAPQVSRDEFNALLQELHNLEARVGGGGKPVAPIPKVVTR